MKNEINLLKNNDNHGLSDLERIEEFYNFLQGKIPGEIHLAPGNESALNENQAWSIIWFLQERLRVFPDNIERCDNCGNLFDIDEDGHYCERHCEHYCDYCMYLVPENYDRGKR